MNPPADAVPDANVACAPRYIVLLDADEKRLYVTPRTVPVE
jgi:hypothetical protein